MTQSRYHLSTLDPKVGTICILGVLGLGTLVESRQKNPKAIPQETRRLSRDGRGGNGPPHDTVDDIHRALPIIRKYTRIPMGFGSLGKCRVYIINPKP